MCAESSPERRIEKNIAIFRIFFIFFTLLCQRIYYFYAKLSNQTDKFVTIGTLAHLLSTYRVKRKILTNNNTTMNVKPLSDRVLVLPNPAEEKTAGGLIIPDTAKEKPLAGKVIAAGPGTAEIKMEVKEGDQVLYGKYAGTEISFEGTSYLILKQSEILAVIE